MSDVSAVIRYFSTVNEGFNTTTSGITNAAGSIVPLNSTAGLTNGSVFVGVIEPGAQNQQTFTGTVDTTGSQITGCIWTRGTNVQHSGGVKVVDYVTGTDFNMLSAGIRKEHKDSGKHGNITTDSITNAGTLTSTGAIFANGGIQIPTGQTVTGINQTMVTIPYKFSAYRSAAWSLPQVNYECVVPFDTEDYDTGNNFSTTTGLFTAPVTGYYHFDTMVSFIPAGTPTTVAFQSWIKNNVSVKRGARVVSRNGDEYALGSGLDMNLNAGDTLGVAVFSSDGGTVENPWVFFTGRILSLT